MVIAYLMKLRQWRLCESYKWVKDKRPSIALSAGAPARWPASRQHARAHPSSAASAPGLSRTRCCACSCWHARDVVTAGDAVSVTCHSLVSETCHCGACSSLLTHAQVRCSGRAR